MGNLLYIRTLLLSWKISIVITVVLSLYNVSVCSGEAETDQLNNPINYNVSDTGLCDAVYPLTDFELPADNEGKIDTIMLRNKNKNFSICWNKISTSWI